jgi:hypothetical protein
VSTSSPLPVQQLAYAKIFLRQAGSGSTPPRVGCRLRDSRLGAFRGANITLDEETGIGDRTMPLPFSQDNVTAGTRRASRSGAFTYFAILTHHCCVSAAISLTKYLDAPPSDMKAGDRLNCRDGRRSRSCELLLRLSCRTNEDE